MSNDGCPPSPHPTTPEHREELLKALAEAWEKEPYLRLGQLLYTFVIRAENGNIFYVKDHVLLERLRQPLNKAISGT